MTIYNSYLRKRSFLASIYAMCLIQGINTHSNVYIDGTASDFSSTLRTNNQHDKFVQKQITVNVQITHNTTSDQNVYNSGEVDDLIRNAVRTGVFKSKDEWIRERHGGDNGKNVRRTTNRNDEDFTISDQPRPTFDDSIKFPGNTNNRPVDVIPNVNICKGESICASVPNYPEQLIKTAIRKYKGALFSTNDQVPESKDLSVDQRIGYPDSRAESVEFCSKQVERIQPRSGINIHGEARYIVNIDNVTHFVAVEKCLNEHTQCNFTTGLLVLGYYPDCVQKYIHRDLHALQPDGSSIRLETFRIPASCCCELRFDGAMRMRNGATTGQI